MMVPKAFFLYTNSKSGPSWLNGEKTVVSDPGAERKALMIPKKMESTQPAPLPSALSPAPATPSKPVLIPTKAKNGVKQGKRNEGRSSGKKTNNPPIRHDPTSLPPSTAALLAMTLIPEPGKRRITGTQPKDIDRKARGLRKYETPRRSLSSSCPQTWDFLLSPPQEHTKEIGSFESNATLGPVSSLRSLSTESMPSLAGDADSLSSFSNPETPGLVGSGRNEKRKKSLATSAGEDCIFDHPLVPASTTSDLQLNDAEEAVPVDATRPASTSFRTSFKSNLTASLRAIRSAARSISDLSAPISQREDYLSRSILCLDIPFTDERRPFPSSDPPDPALRRYLNPITPSPAEFHFHNDREPDSCRASIQLQSYQPDARRSSTASAPPVFLSNLHRQRPQQGHLSNDDALDPDLSHPSSLLPRQREPRENGDFLRVIVLEMNMRRVGKLSDASPGRASLWLPARRPIGKPADDVSAVIVEENEVQRAREGQGRRVPRVPRRWEGVRPP
ncbi:MAG: hypothetical protein Q9163_001829 [Psora crenata]